jgi:integrase
MRDLQKNQTLLIEININSSDIEYNMVETIETPIPFDMSPYNDMTNEQTKLQLTEDLRALKHDQHRLLCCPNCLGSLTSYNFRKSSHWKCYDCKKEFNDPLVRDWDIHKGHSGTVRRDWNKSLRRDGSLYPVYNLEQIVEVIKRHQPTSRQLFELKTYKRIIRENAFVAMLALTGARISEVIGIKKEKEFIHQPIRLKQLTLHHDEKSDSDVIIIREVTCLKHKKVVRYDTFGNKKEFYKKRNLWYPYEGIFKDLYLIINEHIDIMKRYGLKEENPPIFNIRGNAASCYVRRVFQHLLDIKGKSTIAKQQEFCPYPHWLRHSNFTYMANRFKFTDAQLRAYAGWTSPAMAARYVHIQAEDVYRSMLDTESENKKEKVIGTMK